MFSIEEILEEFEEASYTGRARYYALELPLAHLSGEPRDIGTEFLQATEEKREQMRLHPPEPPRSYPEAIAMPKRRWGVITYDDAQRIRAIVPKVVSGREAARRYGVSHITIQRIVAGKTYRADRTRLGPAEIRIRRKQEARGE